MAGIPLFPILDCSTIVLDNDITDDEPLKDFGKRFVHALASNRACYIKHHGIKNDLKEKYMDIHRRFFTQSANAKAPFERKPEKSFGWVAMEKDMYNHEGQSNEIEAFFYVPSDDSGDWPNADLEMCNKKLFDASTSLAGRLCDALSLGLGLEKCFMWNAHKLGLTGANGGSLGTRTNYYRSCSSGFNPGDTRFGAHTDFGTITLLLQDEMDGLEVEVPGQGFVPVAPIPDTVVVIPGDMLQRWTSDSVQAAKHRVVPPTEKSRRKMPRQSIVFFIIPDRDFEIRPVDDSAKYEPIICMDFILETCKKMGYMF